MFDEKKDYIYVNREIVKGNYVQLRSMKKQDISYQDRIKIINAKSISTR